MLLPAPPLDANPLAAPVALCQTNGTGPDHRRYMSQYGARGFNTCVMNERTRVGSER
jgi:hypothetical protein